MIRLFGGGGSGSGNVVLSGWAFGPQSVLGSGTASLTFENATFTNVANSSGLRLTGDLLLLGIGILGRGQDLSLTNTVGDLDSASLNTGNDGASSSDGSVIWSHYGTVQTVTITENSVFNSSFVQAYVPYQTTPLTLSIGATGNNGGVTFIGGMASLNVTSLSGNNTTYEFNGPFDVASVDNLLQKAIDGNVTGSTLTLEGASAAPTVTPEIDELVIAPPQDADSFQIATNDGLSSTVTFSSLVDLIDSSEGGSPPTYTVIIGIQDNPPISAIAAKIVSFISPEGFSSSSNAEVITVTTSVYAAWPLTASNLAGTPITFETTQTGLDRVAQLVAAGNTVTTN